MKTKLSEAFSNECCTRRVFAWLTRTGAGRKFGTLPIGWYQIHQCACIKILREMGADIVRAKFGNIQTLEGGKWKTVISTIELFQKADNRARTT